MANVAVTSQHRQMLSAVRRLFEIALVWSLDVMMKNQTFSELTCAVLKEIFQILEEFHPDRMLDEAWELGPNTCRELALQVVVTFGPQARNIRTHITLR